MKQIKVNPSNKPYYSDDFIKGFECGTKTQFDADKEATNNAIIIQKDATNGDVIMAIFPGCRPIEGTLLIDTDIAVFEPDWWNAPYKRTED